MSSKNRQVVPELRDIPLTFLDCPCHFIGHYIHYPAQDVDACRHSSFPCYALRENNKCPEDSHDRYIQPGAVTTMQVFCAHCGHKCNGVLEIQQQVLDDVYNYLDCTMDPDDANPKECGECPLRATHVGCPEGEPLSTEEIFDGCVLTILRRKYVDTSPKQPALEQCKNCIRKDTRDCMYHGYPDGTIPPLCDYKIGKFAVDTVYSVPTIIRHDTRKQPATGDVLEELDNKILARLHSTGNFSKRKAYVEIRDDIAELRSKQETGSTCQDNPPRSAQGNE